MDTKFAAVETNPFTMGRTTFIVKEQPIHTCIMLIQRCRLLGDLMAGTLRNVADMEVIGVVETTDEALPKLKDCNVILLSAFCPDYEAFKAIRMLQEANRNVKIIVTGLTPLQESPIPYLEAGADGYLFENATVEELIESIDAVRKGCAVVSPEIAAKLIVRVRKLATMCLQTFSSPLEQINLTRRECEVLELITQNMTNREIAERLIIELGTVKNHVHNILKKLEVRNRHEAALHWSRIRQSFGYMS